ncbi:MAG: TrkA family potassium uptake protein [Bacilli bacterium]|nr:TrkA family potassium uptake protein [Bacilli bacterium]
MKQKAAIEFGIIGLGTFGSNLAKKLAKAGREVLAIDQNEDRVNDIKDYVSTAFVVKSLDKFILEETGIQNCETVIVCISKDMAISVLTTLNIVNMGVPRVIAKANSDDHGMILEKLGAEVVYPERDMADRIGGMLLNSRRLDFIHLNGNVSVSEFRIPECFVGMTIKETQLRDKYFLSIVAVESDGETYTKVNPKHILKEDDYMVVVGDNENIEEFEKDFLNQD